MVWNREMRVCAMMCVALLMPSPRVGFGETADREKAAKEVAASLVKELGAAMMREMTKGGPTEAIKGP